MSRQEVISGTSESVAQQRKKLQAVGAGAINLALKHSPETVQRKATDIAVRRILRTKAFNVRHVSDEDEAQKALELEQSVWYAENYGDLEVYKKYIPQSKIFAAYDDGGKVIGMNRLFAGFPETPPFLEEIPIHDDALKQQLINKGKQLKVEEFGTVAVTKELRGSRAFLDICRLAFRDASERGIETWGIIMEPERVQKMNNAFAFTFNQIGPAVDYQGGKCAAHVMDFAEVHAHMQSTKPELYDWFINKPLQ